MFILIAVKVIVLEWNRNGAALLRVPRQAHSAFPISLGQR